MADDVQLTDLEVIQRYSLAVQGATADRDEIVAALRSDLEWLTGQQATPKAAPRQAPARTAPAKTAPRGSAPARRPTKRAPGA